MRKLGEILKGAFHPRPAAIIALVLASTLGLVWCFLFDGAGSPASYVFYALSAYALAVVIIALVPYIAAVRGHVLENHHVALITGDEGLRARASAAWTVLFDLVYATFIMATGFAYDSGWAVAVAVYHVAIAGIGFAMAFGFARARRLHGKQRHVRELKMARTCGAALALMALALSGVMAQMVMDRQAWAYDQVIVIASATFTFANLAFAIKNIAQVRKVESPALVASRATSLSKTLVQLFFLETTMIAVFGKNDAESFRFIMEAITGGAVFFIVLVVAITLIAYAVRRMRAVSSSTS